MFNKITKDKNSPSRIPVLINSKTPIKIIKNSSASSTLSPLAISSSTSSTLSLSPVTVISNSPYTAKLRSKQVNPSINAAGNKNTMNFKKLKEIARADIEKKESSSQNIHQSASAPATTKKKRQKKETIVFDTTPWTEKHRPVDLQDHFVHKKKVEEVTNWILNACDLEIPQDKTKANHFFKMRTKSFICLLTGPSGSGKSASISLICKEFGIMVKEWINPMDLTEFVSPDDDIFERHPDEIRGKSQFEMFCDFLSRASQYNSLPIKGKPNLNKKITLIEDFPGFIFRDTEKFHEILRSYSKDSAEKCPMVCIMADSSSSGSNINKIFPKSLIDELKITQIHFNPVANGFITKYLLKITQSENISSLSKTALEEISILASGDLRCAINTLQFKAQTGRTISNSSQGNFVFKKPNEPKKSRKSADDFRTRAKMLKLDDEVHGVKDDSLFLFHAIGKVLYSKRDLPTQKCKSIENELSSHLEDEKRYEPLLDDPEYIVDKIETSPDMFIQFLQHNYPPFFTNIDDCERTSSYLAYSDVLLSSSWSSNENYTTFKSKIIRDDIALSLSIRGILHSNNHKATNSWRPFQRPLNNEQRQIIQTRHDNCKHLFQNQIIGNKFFSETLSIYKLMINSSVFLKAQKDFIKELNDYGIEKERKKWKSVYQKNLGEMDAIEEEEEEGKEIQVETNGKENLEFVAQDVGDLLDNDQDEEFIIEDWSD